MGDSHWDETLFAGTAQYYEQGRFPYAEGLPDAFRAALGADGTGRLLDVGCGPGSVALRLCRLYEEVVGLDPHAGMIDVAVRLARGRGVTNATFVRAPAEDLPLGLGTFDSVTFASSFHWMDRERVAGIVRTMLRPGGAVLQVDAVPGEGGAAGPYPPPPRHQMRELVRTYLGAERRAGRMVGFVSPTDEEETWRAAGFIGPDLVRVPDDRALARTVDDVVAGTLSLSNSAPHLFGNQLTAFRDDLRALLRRASPTGLFTVALSDTELRIWRPVESSSAGPGSPTG